MVVATRSEDIMYICRNCLRSAGVFAIAFFLTASFVFSLPVESSEIRFIFFFIGDGMGYPQVKATESYLESRGDSLVMTLFPVHGEVTTHSLDSGATDSAAAATALATGYKASSGVLSMNPESGETYKTVAQFARDSGMRVGILTTVAINDATPAAFYSHQPSRLLRYQIGLDLVRSEFDLFAGWGMASRRGTDGESPDILEIAHKTGYHVVREIGKLSSANQHGKKVLALLPIPFAIDRGKEEVSLVRLTEEAVDFLTNPGGFFLMVEGGKIDWACHTNDPGSTVFEMRAFDEAVAVAAAFSEQYPEETLIVVTGDHETGGMSLHKGFSPSTVSLLDAQKVSYERFLTLFESESPSTLEEVLGFVSRTHGFVLDDHDHPLFLEPADRDALQKALVLLKTGDQGEIRKRFAGYHPVMVTANHILSLKAGISWNHHGHGADPVPVYARGAKAELFGKALDNTDIAKLFFHILGSPRDLSAWYEHIPECEIE